MKLYGVILPFNKQTCDFGPRGREFFRRNDIYGYMRLTLIPCRSKQTEWTNLAIEHSSRDKSCHSYDQDNTAWNKIKILIHKIDLSMIAFKGMIRSLRKYYF